MQASQSPFVILACEINRQMKVNQIKQKCKVRQILVSQMRNLRNQSVSNMTTHFDEKNFVSLNITVFCFCKGTMQTTFDGKIN